MPDHTASTAMIVAAFARHNRLTPSDLPALIGTINSSLAGAGEPIPPPPAVPAISARRSVTDDAITCMTCGRQFKSIRRHIGTAHGQTEQEYRAQWGLAKDYPMVAPAYSATRSALAKSIGLGAKGRKATPAKAPAAQTIRVEGKSAAQTVTMEGQSAAKVIKASGPAVKAVAKPHPKPSAAGRPKKVTPEALGETGAKPKPDPMF